MKGYIFAVHAAEGDLAEPAFSICQAPDEKAAKEMAKSTLEAGETLGKGHLLNENGFAGFAKIHPDQAGAVRVGGTLER